MINHCQCSGRSRGRVELPFPLGNVLSDNFNFLNSKFSKFSLRNSHIISIKSWLFKDKGLDFIKPRQVMSCWAKKDNKLWYNHMTLASHTLKDCDVGANIHLGGNQSTMKIPSYNTHRSELLLFVHINKFHCRLSYVMLTYT
jgi:hypothetical protein